ncbi:MAG: glutamate synthase, partial [Eubacteriales bacterium]
RVCKTDYGQEEAIAVFGKDPRRYQITVKEIVKDPDGHITAVVTVLLQPEKDPASGRTVMKEVPDSTECLPCDLLLIAAGFVGCEPYVAESFGVARSPRGNLQTETGRYTTEVPKVFCAGDAHRGQSLVVWAIAEGRACAAEVDAFLSKY